MKLWGEPTGSEWAWTAYLAVMAVGVLAMIAVQVAKGPGPVQEVSLPPIEVTSASAAFYGPPRDTSAIKRLCCRVSR